MNNRHISIESTSSPTYAELLLRVLLVTLIIILSMHLLLQFLNLNVFYQQNGQIYELSNRFDLDDESSVPTWFSQALLLAISVSAWLAAYVQTNKSKRRLWVVIALLGLVFSIDEIAALHEYTLQSLHVLSFGDAASSAPANAWILVAPLVLLVMSWMIWKAMRLLPRRILGLFGLSGAIFLAGAMGVDVVTSFVPRDTFLNQGLLIALEEMLELLGTSLVLYTIVHYLESYHYTVLARATRSVKSTL